MASWAWHGTACALCAAMESLMAWRLVRPVIMAPNVRPDADGIEVIKQAVEVSAHRDHM